MTKIKGVIFDLDGVLTNASDAHFSAWKALAKTIGIDLPDHFESRLKGVSRKVSLERILDYGGLTIPNGEQERLREQKNTHYQAIIRTFDASNLYQGVELLLNQLRSVHVKIALGSASLNAPMLIDALGIAQYFDYVVNPKKLKSKPAPDIFLDAQQAFKLPSAACLGIEDAVAGIDAIKAANMHAVGIGDAKELMHADACFPNIQAATPYILNCTKG